MGTVKRVGYLLLFVALGVFMPVGILVAGGAALRRKRHLSRVSDPQAMAL